jgi:membrane protease subunit HflK
MARRSDYPPNPADDFLRQIDLRRAAKFAGMGLVVLIAAVGAMTSFYTVQPEGQAVVKRFGRVVKTQPPGLQFRLPFWIDRVYFVPTERVLKQEFGFRTMDSGGRSGYDKSRFRDESLMLTGDLNVIDVEWVVQYRVGDPDKYLHVARDPNRTIRDVSEAVMRRIVGSRVGSNVLTEGRVEIATSTRTEMQEILDHLDIGVRIVTVEMQDVTPPDRVKPAFNEVNEAEQERERLINEAERRRNQVIPLADGEAKQVIEEAQGYAAERVNRAEGDVSRFLAILEQFENAPETTRRRMYLETIDDVLPRMGKVYIVDKGQTGPIPILNLDRDRTPATGGN